MMPHSEQSLSAGAFPLTNKEVDKHASTSFCHARASTVMDVCFANGSVLHADRPSSLSVTAWSYVAWFC